MSAVRSKAAQSARRRDHMQQEHFRVEALGDNSEGRAVAMHRLEKSIGKRILFRWDVLATPLHSDRSAGLHRVAHPRKYHPVWILSSRTPVSISRKPLLYFASWSNVSRPATTLPR